MSDVNLSDVSFEERRIQHLILELFFLFILFTLWTKSDLSANYQSFRPGESSGGHFGLSVSPESIGLSGEEEKPGGCLLCPLLPLCGLLCPPPAPHPTSPCDSKTVPYE